MISSIPLSIIIPTYNEAEGLGALLQYLHRILATGTHEIIIADGGSQDDTLKIAQRYGAKTVVAAAGRARQLNAGAAVAKGTILYFLHADSRPPVHLGGIAEEFAHSDYLSGSFRLRFSPDTLLLRQCAYFTRFNNNAFRFGDASLLVKREVFRAIGGFDESFLLMEDNDIIRRLRCYGPFKLYTDEVTTSSRKYLRYGDWYLQSVYVLIYLLQRLGVRQKNLWGIYQRSLNFRA